MPGEGFDALFDEDPPARPHWQRGALLVGALLLFLLGVVGWIVPVISGVPFHLGGLCLLGMTSPAMARRLNGLERRLPARLRRLLRPRGLRSLRERRRAARDAVRDAA